jgi:predicted negative regulator of RcsB-dependent stress response
MAKHPTARRVHRTDNADDAFVAGVLESSVWARNHQRIITIGGVALVLLLAVFLYLRNYRSNLSNQATVQLTAVRQTVLQGNRQLAIRDLNTYVSKYGKTSSGDEARLMLAQLYAEEKQTANAVKAIKPIANEPGGSNGASAALLLGAIYEAGKQPGEAEKVYLQIADDARFGFEKREALERAAGLRLQRGNTAGAAELYDRALKTLPEDSPERTVYQMRIAEVTAAR